MSKFVCFRAACQHLRSYAVHASIQQLGQFFSKQINILI